MAKTYKFHNQDKSIDLNLITDGIKTYDSLFINDVQGTLSNAVKNGLDYDIEPVTEVELLQKAINKDLYLVVFDGDTIVEYLNFMKAVLTSPDDEATDVAIAGDLTWNEVIGATSYDVYLWETSGSKPSTPTDNVTDLSYSYSGLTNSTEYSWQIVAKNDDVYSESEVRTFTTIAA